MNEQKEHGSFDPCDNWSKTSSSAHPWPRHTQDDHVRYVMSGRFDDLPPSISKVVRIFLSSTFTDTYTERNMLIKNVYPRLKRLCRDKYQLDFQVVDMRWGIRKEASVDHSASELCMKEIHNCKKVSVGPTFVALVSHRYGGRQLPATLSVQEMESILNSIKTEEDDHAVRVALVQKWYILDENAIPNEYILKPIADYKQIEILLQETSSHALADKKKQYAQSVTEAKLVWKADEKNLKEIVRAAVKKLVSQGTMSKQSGRKFFYSITEEEILEGLVNESRSNDRCLVFMRDVENINTSHPKASRYLDVKENGEVDKETEALLTDLRESIIPNNLQSENIHRFRTQWTDNGGINEGEHKDYLKEFCETFEKSILGLIEHGVKKISSSTLGKSIYPEILEHSHHCRQKVEMFQGREKSLGLIRSYLISVSRQPLVVYGESGCGKTSVLAKAATLVPEWLGDSQNLVIVLRFLGITPDSSSIYNTLKGITQQIITMFHLDKLFPELSEDLEFSSLKDIFQDVLKGVPIDKRVVIFLDSLDQLSPGNNAFNLLWLPKKLPSNVKFVVSTLPVHENILNNLRSRKMSFDDKNFIEVKDLENKTSLAIIHMWLEKNHRCLNQQQEGVLTSLLDDAVRPLYLKLVFDELSSWKSYEIREYNCKTIHSCLDRFYKKIEMKHGETLVSKALGYLSASKNGLTESELEDILSLDDEVLNEVFEFHTPPIRRIPSILWARIRNDLEYIVNKEADGVTVMAWYHRQFIEKASLRYLLGKSDFQYKVKCSETAFQLYKVLADYFAGVWTNGKKKPFQYTETQAKKLVLSSLKSEEDRYVSDQPVQFNEVDISNVKLLRYNKRKLSELPHACLQICQHTDNAEFITKHIGMDQKFVSAWMQCVGWDTIANFFEMVIRVLSKLDIYYPPDVYVWDSIRTGTLGLLMQLYTIWQCLMLSYVTSLKNPTYTGCDITGRILHLNGLIDDLSSWIHYTDTEGRKTCALIPPHVQLETTGGELMYILNNSRGQLRHAVYGINSGALAMASQKFVVCDMETMEITINKRPRNVPVNDEFEKTILAINPAKPDEFLLIVSLAKNPWVYVFDKDGEVLNVIKIVDDCFKITDMCWGWINEEIVLCAVDRQQNVIYYAHDILHSEKELFIKKLEWKRGATLLNIIAQTLTGKEKMVKEILGKTNKSKMLFYDKGGFFEARYADGTIINNRQFSWSQNIVSHSANVNLDNVKIVLGFENGQICVLIWPLDDDDLELTSVFLYTDEMIQNSKTFGIPHYVHHYEEINDIENAFRQNQTQENKVLDQLNVDRQNNRFELSIGLACTNTHLLLFGNPRFFEKGMILNPHEIKVYARIKKRYNLAIYAMANAFVLAAYGGSVDLIRVDKKNRERPKFHFYTTIDAHGQDICELIMGDDEDMFMSRSLDSTIKVYITSRAGKRKLPPYSRTERNIDVITLLMDDTTLTFTKASSMIYQWKPALGIIYKIFQPENDKSTILSYSTSKTRDVLLAINQKGQLYFWNENQLTEISNTTDKHHIYHHAQYINPDQTLDTAHVFPQTSKYEDVHLLVFSGIDRTVIFIASTCGQEVTVVNIFEEIDDDITVSKENVEDDVTDIIPGPFQFAIPIQGDDDKVLLIQDKCIIVFDVTKMAVKFKSNLILAAVGQMSDVAYCKNTNSIVFTSDNKVTIWKIGSEKEISEIALDSVNIGDCGGDLKVLPNLSNQWVIIALTSMHYTVLDVQNKKLGSYNHIKNVTTKVQLYKCTSDGRYLVYLTNDTQLYLTRLSDGKLLAWYTMYMKVSDLNISSDNWYVLIATQDRRLFMLVIADPDEREHDKRIQQVRSLNVLPQEVATAVMKDAMEYDSDEFDEEDGDDGSGSDVERDIADAVRRIERRAFSSVKRYKVHYSSDESENEDDYQSRSVSGRLKKRPTLHKRKTTQRNLMGEAGSGRESPCDPIVTNHGGGELVSSAPCSLQ